MSIASLNLEICATLSDFVYMTKSIRESVQRKAVLFSMDFWLYRKREI